MFEQSHVPLNMWLQAVALICASKKGMPSTQLSRVLNGVSPWHRICVR